MKFQSLTMFLVALAMALPAAAQDDAAAVVDTTFISEDGQILRYRGVLPSIDKPGSAERVAEMTQDDRVPLGFGFRTLRLWKEGDPRRQPEISETHVISEFVDLEFDGPYVPINAALGMAEYGDYAYFALKDRLGWELPGGEPVPVSTTLDLKGYGKRFGLPWWAPGDVQDGRIVLEPISVITSRKIAMECFIHYYFEWQMRERTGDRVPYWFLYGAGAYFGAEGWVLKGQVEPLAPTLDTEVDQATMIRDLEIFRDRELMMREVEQPGVLEMERNHSRFAYWRAFRLLENIMTGEGLKPFKAAVAAMEVDPELSFEAAVAEHYGKSLEALVTEYEPW